MNRSALLAALLLAGCSPPESAGTSVGNPGSFAITAGPGSGGVNVTGGTVDVSRLAFAGCDGTEEVLAEEEVIELGSTFQVPAGTWCTVDLVPADALVVEFAVDQAPGEEYDLVLGVESLTAGPAAGGFEVAEDGAFVFELGTQGWIDFEDLEFDDEDDLVEDAALIVQLEGVVAEDSGLYEDTDADGELDGEERDAGAVATPTDEEVEDGEEKDSAPACGGGESGAAVAWLLCGLPVALLRRRFEFRLAPQKAPDTENLSRVIRLRGTWRAGRAPRSRRRASASRRKPGARARQWRLMLEEGVYESRAALARGEGVSRAAVTQALGPMKGEGR